MDWQGSPGNMQENAEAFSDDLRRLLRTEVLRGEASASQIAGLCLVHRRTMSRRLRAEGTRFRRVADEVRFEIACQLLRIPHITFSEVATLLGFSEGSAFTRAFRRWSGQTPTAWRASHPRQRQVHGSQ
jgi:AraC-like DNA-binding protein